MKDIFLYLCIFCFFFHSILAEDNNVGIIVGVTFLGIFILCIFIVIIVVLMVYFMRLVGTDNFALLHVIICEIQLLILALVRSSFMHSNDYTLNYVFVYQHSDLFIWLRNSQI